MDKLFVEKTFAIIFKNRPSTQNKIVLLFISSFNLFNDGKTGKQGMNINDNTRKSIYSHHCTWYQCDMAVMNTLNLNPMILDNPKLCFL